MLRKRKVDVVLVESTFCYNEITKLEGDFIMKLPDKIIKHRKANGWSQEDFAEKLNVSRQAMQLHNSYCILRNDNQTRCLW